MLKFNPMTLPERRLYKREQPWPPVCMLGRARRIEKETARFQKRSGIPVVENPNHPDRQRMRLRAIEAAIHRVSISNAAKSTISATDANSSPSEGIGRDAEKAASSSAPCSVGGYQPHRR
jgi:hypothetical protein